VSRSPYREYVNLTAYGALDDDGTLRVTASTRHGAGRRRNYRARAGYTTALAMRLSARRGFTTGVTLAEHPCRRTAFGCRRSLRTSRERGAFATTVPAASAVLVSSKRQYGGGDAAAAGGGSSQQPGLRVRPGVGRGGEIIAASAGRSLAGVNAS